MLTELKETIPLMESDNYKERFKAEYYQLIIRYEGLLDLLEQWDKGELPFKPTCPRSTYDIQARAMADYIAIMEARAVMENIKS